MEKNDVTRTHEIIVIGGSAGSLEVILRMLGHITTRNFPIVVILHRKSATDSLLAQVLADRSVLKVKEAEEKEAISQGTVYLAPADYHLLAETDHTFSLDYSEKVNFSRPSIDVSFESIASVYGQGTVGILLSGGNSDGADGLAAIKEAGGMCVVQDPETAEIAFMPGHAVHSDVADLILKTDEFAGFINRLK